VEAVSIEGWQNRLPEFQTLGDPQLELMKQEAVRFGREFARAHKTPEYHAVPRWLTLLGKSGVGKTLLCRLLILKLGGAFYPWHRVANWLREGEYRIFEDICRDRRIVCIDDIGSEYRTDFLMSKLYELLSERDKRWTLLTGNLSLEAIGEQLDRRISSRMIRHGNIVVETDTKDFNLRK
jgi:DNA replication protein DnaC